MSGEFTTCATDETCPRCDGPALFVTYDGDEGISGDGLICSNGSGCGWYEGCENDDPDAA